MVREVKEADWEWKAVAKSFPESEMPFWKKVKEKESTSREYSN